jgi:hypothetical protein
MLSWASVTRWNDTALGRLIADGNWQRQHEAGCIVPILCASVDLVSDPVDRTQLYEGKIPVRGKRPLNASA